MQRSSRLQSTNATRPPARWIASGVAMKVFEGHRTVSPATPANSSAASAPPAQPPKATAPSSFWADHSASNRSVIGPSDHRSDSITSSQRR